MARFAYQVYPLDVGGVTKYLWRVYDPARPVYSLVWGRKPIAHRAHAVRAATLSIANREKRMGHASWRVRGLKD